MSRIDTHQLKDLRDELATLVKLQYEARLVEIFIRMTPEEIETFSIRAERISEICIILSEHDAGDNPGRALSGLQA